LLRAGIILTTYFNNKWLVDDVLEHLMNFFKELKTKKGGKKKEELNALFLSLLG